MTKEVYITTNGCGTLVAEVDGEKIYETEGNLPTYFGYGDTVEVDEFSDPWELIGQLNELAEMAEELDL